MPPFTKQKISRGFLIRSRSNVIVKTFIGDDLEKLESSADKFISNPGVNNDSIYRFDGLAIIKAQKEAGEIIPCFDIVKINLDGHTFEPGTNFLKIDAISTRTGIFEYSDGVGGVRRELRRDVDILKPESLNTMMHIPFTINHPDVMLNPNNVKDHIKGFTGGFVDVIDGENGEVLIKQPVIIFDKCSIDLVLSHEIPELSLGYTLNHDKTPGVHTDGKAFDVIQINHIHNHLSGVDAARAGKQAKFLFDNQEKPGKIIYDFGKINNHGGKPMQLVHINGENVEVSDEAKIKIDAETKRRDEESDVLKAEKEKLRADRDIFKGKIDSNDKVVQEKLDAAMDDKFEVLFQVKPLLSADQFEAARKLSIDEIKKVGLKIKGIDVKDGESSEYIDGMFDGAVVNAKVEKTVVNEKPTTAFTTLMDELGKKPDGKKPINNDGTDPNKDGEEDDSDINAFMDEREDLQTAYRSDKTIDEVKKAKVLV